VVEISRRTERATFIEVKFSNECLALLARHYGSEPRALRAIRERLAPALRELYEAARGVEGGDAVSGASVATTGHETPPTAETDR
jgi:hypothetical protein